jgi:hypothetical protein
MSRESRKAASNSGPKFHEALRLEFFYQTRMTWLFTQFSTWEQHEIAYGPEIELLEGNWNSKILRALGMQGDDHDRPVTEQM